MLLIYVGYYCALDTTSGLAFAPVLTVMYLLSYRAVSKERERNGTLKSKGKEPPYWSWGKVAFVVHALGWIMQIGPGHGHYEGVKPALMDSLGQALGVAPLFAFLEGWWMMGGSPETAAAVGELVLANRRAMCEAGRDMPWC